MDLRSIIAIATIGLTLMGVIEITPAAQPKKKLTHFSPQTRSSRSSRLADIHERLMARMRASRDGLKEVVADYEEQLARESADYERKKRDYQNDLISQAELENSARAVGRTRLEIQRVQQWIAEDNAALSLADDAVREQQERLSDAPVGESIVTRTFIRYNGKAHWSLDDANKISSFFLEHYGHAMPISAMGQTPTHDRMGFDHREALDVAVRPDSAEGRGLIAYLRQVGIPFIAFRSRVRGIATGAHIHIGRPSLRIMHVKQVLNPPPAAAEKGDAQG
jgi:hypothetical protein